ncbi:hypothetical protein ACLK19_23185 [Escherichia coli]
METTRKNNTNLTEGASRSSFVTRGPLWPAERRDGEILAKVDEPLKC